MTKKTKKEWKQTERLYNCTGNSAWEQGLFYSNMYPPNMSVKWLDTDTPEAAQYEKDITYEFNGHGFRSDDFTETSEINILTCGCSLTVGVGVDQHEIWPYRLKKLIEEETSKSVTVWNLATSGASGDYVARSLWKVKTELHSDFTFVYWPPSTRLELPMLDHYDYKIEQTFLEDEHYLHDLKNSTYLDYNTDRNIVLAKLLSGKHLLSLSEVNCDTLARDGMHPGLEWHNTVAQLFLKQYTEMANLKEKHQYYNYQVLKEKFNDK